METQTEKKHISQRELKTLKDVYAFVDYELWRNNYITTQKAQKENYQKALIKIKFDLIKLNEVLKE